MRWKLPWSRRGRRRQKVISELRLRDIVACLDRDGRLLASRPEDCLAAGEVSLAPSCPATSVGS